MEDKVEDFEALLVYGDPKILEAVSSAFEEKGCRISKALEADEAIDLLKSRPFDVVLTSLVMSPKQRDAVMKAAKGFNPDTILILLGCEDDLQHDTLSFGESVYVFSPCGMPELWKRVENCLQIVELRKRDEHARDLVHKFREQIKLISGSISGEIREELVLIAERMKLLRDGAYGKMNKNAVTQLGELLDRVNWLIKETGSLSQGFIPQRKKR
jgi:response regulator RpfG family c-di-GMP phosphodiesterase